MFTKEERDILATTLKDTILQNVPGALEITVSNGVFAYKSPEQNGANTFCLLLIASDHLELRFPVCPRAASAAARFEEVHGTDGCRLVIRKRTNIPGKILNTALMEAAGIA